MKNAALAIAGFVLLAIGFIERCWLNGPGIAVLAATGRLFDLVQLASKRSRAAERRARAFPPDVARLRHAAQGRGVFLVDAIVTALTRTTGLLPWIMAS
jgi:hypothetical protein